MARDEERAARAAEQPIVNGLPEVPGILVAMKLSPGLASHLRGLADELLVKDFPGATLTRAERELIATAVSATNDCFYCMDTHGAFAAELMSRARADSIREVIDGIKNGGADGVGMKMRALLVIARGVAQHPRDVSREDVLAALGHGASDGDVQLTVLIASAFCMYNRMVDGLRTRTPATDDAYTARAVEIADHGYSSPKVTAVPT